MRPSYAFGPFLLDPAERRLVCDGRLVTLSPKALDVLAVLAAHAGHLVTKDELLAAAWPGVVVEENALSVAVSRLCSALGEAGSGFVETVPGYGYRLVAPVAIHAAPEPEFTRTGRTARASKTWCLPSRTKATAWQPQHGSSRLHRNQRADSGRSACSPA